MNTRWTRTGWVLLTLAAGCAASSDVGPAGEDASTDADSDARNDEDATDADAETADAADADAAEMEELEHIEGVTYHHDIRPVIASSCAGCHTPGGVAPFRLDRLADVEKYRELVVAAVVGRSMPPWPVDEACHPVRDSLALSTHQLSLFASWKDDGFAEGDEDDYEAPERAVAEDPGEPDIVMSAGKPYTPDAGLSDDYRCFVMEGHFEHDTYVRGMDIMPGNLSIVHHAQIHIIPESRLEAAREMDAASEGLGYTCFGGVGVQDAANVFSWRPGSSAVMFDEGDAGFIRAGSHVVIQVHYNTQWVQAGEQPDPDETRIGFWTLGEGEVPERVVQRRMLTNFRLDIPPGEAEVVTQGTSSVNAAVGGGGFFSRGTFVSGEVVGMTPHMHNLGTRLKVELLREGEEDSTCLIDVPRWDFEWQFDYLYPRRDFFALEPSDRMRITCVYDNSVQNQPVILGERQSPRRVGWGDGSLDEMCLSYVWVRYEREPYLTALGLGEEPDPPADAGSEPDAALEDGGTPDEADAGMASDAQTEDAGMPEPADGAVEPQDGETPDAEEAAPDAGETSDAADAGQVGSEAGEAEQEDGETSEESTP